MCRAAFHVAGSADRHADPGTQVSDDLSILRGEHQFGFGGNYIYSQYDPESYTSAAGNTSFNGGVTGLGCSPIS